METQERRQGEENAGECFCNILEYSVHSFAQSMHSFCTVHAQFLHSPCTVFAQSMHSIAQSLVLDKRCRKRYKFRASVQPEEAINYPSFQVLFSSLISLSL